MATKRTSLAEKLRERRKAMQDSQSSINNSQDPTNSTWSSAMDTENPRHQPAVKMLDDIDRADGMVKELETRRMEKKKELNKTLKTMGDDVSAEIRSARQKSRGKVMRDPEDEGGEDVAEEEMNILEQPAPATPREIPASSQVSLKRGSEGFNTLREKLRSKVQSGIKSKPEDVSKDESQPQRTLKGRREHSVATRFDDNLLGKENAELEEQLSRSLDLRNKWKKAIDRVKPENDIPTREEQFDFFTNTYDDIEEEQEKRASVMRAGINELQKRPSIILASTSTGHDASADAKKDEDKDEDTVEDTAQLIPKGPDDLDGKLWVMTGSEYIPSQDKIERERTVYYMPSSRLVPLNEKVSDDNDARDIAEEGLYVGRRPLVMAEERNKMENRLLQEPDGLGLKWFGEDGEILSLPDPVKEIPSRPIQVDEPDPAIQTFYRKAITKEFDSRYIDGTIDSGGQYRLDVDINTLMFTHHDLMSREHVLASRLTTLCKQYQERKKANIVDYHVEKIRALKSAILHIKEVLLSQNNIDIESGESQYVQSLQKRLKDYVHELREQRKLCDNEERADKELLKGVTRTWTNIKALRTFQNCTNTSVKLNFTKIETNRVEDKNRIKREMSEEVEELREEHEIMYKKLKAEYDIQIAKYKQQTKAKKDATNRMKKRQRRLEEEPDDVELIDEDNKDQAILDQPDLLKPELPGKFDEKTAREQIEEKYKQIKRRPGEPILVPELTHSCVVTASRICPQGEMSRREAVQNCRLYAKVFFNGKPVACTDARQLNQDFTVSFAQIIPIHIIQWPDSVSIQIFEVSMLKDRLLATVYAAIPPTTLTSESEAELDSLEFATEQKRTHGHEAVGSGVPITFDLENFKTDSLVLFTAGNLQTKTTWGVDPYGNPLIPVISHSQSNVGAMKGRDAVMDIGASAMMDIEKLSKWLTDSRIDPNDPANSELIYLLKPKGGGERISGPEYFRLEQLQEEFNFVTDEDLNADRRLKLLELREKEVPEFRNMKMIPANNAEVHSDVFKDYNKRLLDESKIKDEGGDSHRARVIKFMQRVREQVLERKRQAAHQKSLQDIITEESVPNIAAIVLNLGNMLEPRRPLRPRRKERKTAIGQSLQDREVNVMVNITRADNVPCRAGDNSSNRVRPFFEIMFQREKKVTSVASGPNPCWNEELNLPFRAPNDDYSATNLQTVNDFLYINLFDEFVTDILADDRQRGRTVHHRLEKKWLGGIQIPFSTLYTNGVIEGTFRVDSPAVLLGYTRDSGRRRSTESGNAESTYVNLFLTIEPPLGVAPEIKEAFETNESEELLEAAGKYMEQLEKQYPNRIYTTAAIDINGKTVFVTKYMKALAAPEDVLSLPGVAEENIARYVSLIPYISDSITFPGMCDIWGTCDQFLQMLSGDEEEHALLLTNYFLHQGKDAYLCIGNAIPEGATAYTLVREGNSTSVWNAMKGEKYTVTDTFIPLVSIGCLINGDNIWANIQKVDHPNRMTFNLNDTKAWKPFFTSSFPNPGLPTVQPSQLIYFETDRSFARDLQERLEQTLKDKFEKVWRPRDVTRWNRNNMQIFRQLLTGLEATRGKDASQQHSRELENITANYKLTGFTLNMPYTDVEQIANAVYATGVWENDNSGVEFALAVHIHPYPNSVLSVWIYVASLERLRS